MILNKNDRHSLTNQPTRPLMCRGVRGATTVTANDPEQILTATRELLCAIVRANEMEIDDIASVYFTTTADLNTAYPALAARQLGWSHIALLCGHEMNIPGGLPLCIRVLIHWNTIKRPREIHNVYLKEARTLRSDRSQAPPIRPIRVNQMEAAMRLLAHA